jgi:uncharacterized membrane protein
MFHKRLSASTIRCEKRRFIMKKRLPEFCLLVVIIFVMAGGLAIAQGTAVAAADMASDYEAVKKTIEKSIDGTIEKDFEAMYRLWADNMVISGCFPTP